MSNCYCCHQDLENRADPDDPDYCGWCATATESLERRIRTLEKLVKHEISDNGNPMGGYDCTCGMPWIFGNCMTGLGAVEVGPPPRGGKHRAAGFLARWFNR